MGKATIYFSHVSSIMKRKRQKRINENTEETNDSLQSSRTSDRLNETEPVRRVARLDPCEEPP